MKLDLNMTIGESVTKYPSLAGVYMTYGVDYCCGGDRTVEEAIKDSKTDSQRIIKALDEKLKTLENQGESTIQLSELASAQLIDNIVNKHHTFLRQVLPELSHYLFKLIEVHGQNHPELFEVHHLVGVLRLDLEAHLVKEEKQLFPAIIRNDRKAVAQLIDMLEKEHEVAGDVLKQLTVVTNHFDLPQDACKTYQVTYKLLQQLQVDMYEHVHKENSVLFKRFVNE